MSDAAWHPDPLGRFELRWWDGEQWTEHVATGGQQGVDPEPIVVGGAQEHDAATDGDHVVDDAAGAGGDATAATGVEDDATVGTGVEGDEAAAPGDEGDAPARTDDEESVGASADIATVDPPSADDAIALDGDAGESWPTAQDGPTTATDVGAAEESAAGDVVEEQAPATVAVEAGAAEDEAVGDGDDVPAADVDVSGEGDAVTRGEAADRQADEVDLPQEALPGAAVLAVGAPSAAAPPAAAGDLGPDGIGGGLLDDSMYAEREGARVVLQNPRLLRVSLGRDVMIKRGSMVAYQGQMTFEAESEGGGLGSLVRRAASSDNSKMARVSGSGDLFLADAAYEVHLLELAGGGLVVNGPNLLAFEEGMTFRTRSLGNAGIVAGGVFVTDVSGTGWVAVTAHGTPVRLTTDAPTFVDAGAAVAWSSSLQVDLNVQKLGFKSMRSGEIAQLVFRGEGFVLVQASEGAAVPPHNH